MPDTPLLPGYRPVTHADVLAALSQRKLTALMPDVPPGDWYEYCGRLDATTPVMPAGVMVLDYCQRHAPYRRVFVARRVGAQGGARQMELFEQVA